MKKNLCMSGTTTFGPELQRQTIAIMTNTCCPIDKKRNWLPSDGCHTFFIIICDEKGDYCNYNGHNYHKLGQVNGKKFIFTIQIEMESCRRHHHNGNVFTIEILWDPWQAIRNIHPNSNKNVAGMLHDQWLVIESSHPNCDGILY